MANLITFVEHLSETIGPRPATTDAEERAATYVRDAFEARGLDAELQPFDSPRTYGWAYVIYHLLTIGAALLSRISLWPALILGAATAIVMWSDLDTRWGLTSLMPKGPSQNVIARHVPKSGRNERIQRVVVVAHYDSARSSLAFSPGMVKNFATTFGLMKGCAYAVPVLVALRIVGSWLPFAAKLEPWGWYVTLVPAVYLLIPLLINVHRELFMRFTPGANDNASGVAAMFGVMERIVPEPDVATVVARETARMRTEEETWAADVMPEGAVLSYAPVSAPAPRVESWSEDEDISWDTGVVTGQTSLGFETSRPRPAAREEAAPAPAPPGGPKQPTADEAYRLFGVSRPPAPAREDRAEADFGDELDGATAPFEMPPAEDEPHSPAVSRRGLFGGARGEGEKPSSEHRGVRDWLGVGGDFDARKTGKQIGSWDNFEEDDDDTGWKGGAAAIDDLDDPGFAASEAARIRRKVTMTLDRDLTEKEIWFVATGAEEVGTVGMKALLAQYGSELKDAVIINLDNVGAGSVSYVTREGMARRYESDRRLVGATRRAVREADLAVKGTEYRGLSTDATAALARGFRAMSIMAFDINHRLPNWHWATDTADNVAEENLAVTVDLVTAIIREL